MFSSQIITHLIKFVVVSALCCSSFGLQAQSLVSDSFDDDSVGTNLNGPGSGFFPGVFGAAPEPVEAGGTVFLLGGGSGSALSLIHI